MNNPANLRRNNPDSAGVEFTPLNKRGRSSVSMKDNMVRNKSGTFDKEKHRNQLLELKRYCEGLQSVIENTYKQVAQLCRIISKMQSTEEEESLPNEAIPTAEEQSLANTPEMMGNHSMDPDTASSSVHIHPNLEGKWYMLTEVPKNEETKLEIYPLSLGNTSDLGTHSLTHTLQPNVEMVKVETNQRENTQVMSNAPLLGNNNGQDSPRVVMHCNDSHTEVRSETVICPTLTVENGSAQATDTKSFIIPPGYEGKWYMLTEVPKNEETKLEIYPLSLGNTSDLGTHSLTHTLQPNVEMVKVETNQRENTQVMSNAPLLGNNNGQDSPRVVMHCNDSHTEVRSETVICPTLTVENGSAQATDTKSFIIPPGYALLPFGVLVKANGMGNSNGTMISPTVLKNENSHGSSLSSDPISLHIGYIGNPERNVTILKMHLMNAQRKPEPKHAARYLARVLFSKEVLVCSSVGTSPCLPNLRNRQPLDPNKLAAIREFLATVFPNRDLCENGKEWRTCLSYINALIRYLRSTIRGTSEIVVPTNPNIPVSANLNNNRDGDGGEGSSQLWQQAAVSEASARGNYQPNSSAVPEGVEKPSTSDLPIPFGALDYFGNPSRNIKLSHSVLMIAKRKASPEMSARYLMSHLFPEEVLLKSDACGNLWHGICDVSVNKINALREFLQGVFQKCDLSENGRDWKLCMHSINCYIGSCRGGHGNLTCESLPPEAITTAVKSESSDTDYSD